MVDEKLLDMAIEIVKKYKPETIIELAVKIADENNDNRLKEMGI